MSVFKEDRLRGLELILRLDRLIIMIIKKVELGHITILGQVTEKKQEILELDY